MIAALSNRFILTMYPDSTARLQFVDVRPDNTSEPISELVLSHKNLEQLANLIQSQLHNDLSQGKMQ
jgi:hypothetical protein